MNRNLIILIVAIVLAGGLGYVLKPDTPESVGATGASFNIVHEYVSVPASGVTTNTTSTVIASTSPIYFLANSTTTIIVLTSGISDLRLNFIVHATTTVEGGGPEISVAPRIRGNNGIDVYNNTVLSTTGVTQVATPTEVYFLDATATTSLTTILSPDSDNFFAASFQISNFNAPYTILEVGATVDSDIHIEIEKITPNQ